MSKTVKRVSKTVKRVMTVMMIGLVGMLGAKAEAHWIVVRGKCFWHSGECVRQDKDVRDPVPILFPPRGEVVATLKQVDILCPGEIVRKLDLSNQGWTLAAQERIVQSDITRVTNPEGKISRNAEWTVVFSDGHFIEDPTSTFCEGKGPPQDVIIRAMSIKMNLYCSSLTDKECFSKPSEPHSTWEAETCTLPETFDFKNLPSRGTRYACSGTSRCHRGVCEKL